MDNEVKVNIVTKADTSGAQAAASSIDKVTQATAQASAETEKAARNIDFAAQTDRKATAEKIAHSAAVNTTSKELSKLGEASEKGATFGRILGEVMQGNIGYVAQLGVAFKALATAVKTNAFGILLIAGTTLLAFLPKLLERFGLLKKATNDTGDAAATAEKQVQAFADTEADFSKLTAQLRELRDQADSVTAAVDRLRGATDAVEDAERDVAIAEIDRREAEALSDQNLPEDERRRLKDQFALEREGVRQASAEQKADNQVARSREKILLNQRDQQANIEEQSELAIKESTARRKLGSYESDAARLNRMISGFGDPLNQTEDQKKIVAQAKTELEVIEKAIAEGRTTLAKIQSEQRDAKKRGDTLANQAEPLRKEAIAADLNAKAVRIRGETSAQAAANARKAANKSAMEAERKGSTGPMFDPVTGRIPPYVPPPAPSFRVGGVDRSELLRPQIPLTPTPPADAPGTMRVGGVDRSDLLRGVKSAESAVRSAPSLDGITGALSGLVDAIETRANRDGAAIGKLERRIDKVEQQLRNGREGK